MTLQHYGGVKNHFFNKNFDPFGKNIFLTEKVGLEIFSDFVVDIKKIEFENTIQ